MVNFLSRFREGNAHTATPPDALPTTNPAVTTKSKSPRKGVFGKKEGHTTDYGTSSREFYNRRPTFKEWLTISWPDIVMYIIVAIISLVIFKHAPYAGNRLFPITFQDGEVVYSEFAYESQRKMALIKR